MANSRCIFFCRLGGSRRQSSRCELGRKKDPLSPHVQFRLSYVLLSAGRFKEAAAHCQKLPADAPCLARTLLGQGRIDEAIRILKAAVTEGVKVKEGVKTDSVLAYAYARAGRREEAERLAALAGPIGQARIFAGLGDKDRAFKALDRAISSGSVRIGRDLTWPEFAPLRGDSRLKALRKKIGLPE